MFAAFSILTGSVLAVVGVWLAAERPRPASLGGMLLAPSGVLLALWGVARWLAG